MIDYFSLFFSFLFKKLTFQVGIDHMDHGALGQPLSSLSQELAYRDEVAKLEANKGPFGVNCDGKGVNVLHRVSGQNQRDKAAQVEATKLEVLG